MLERVKGEIVFHCDGKRCAIVLNTELDDFREALEELEEAGWVARRRATEWLHICSDCLEEETRGMVL